MRLLVVAEDFPALSETFVIQQVIGLRRLGIDVTVIADRRRPEGAVHEDVVEHGLLDHALYADSSGTRRALAGWVGGLVARADGGALLEVARAVHDRVRVGGIHCSPGRLARFHAVLKDRIGGFDAVLCHFGPNGEMMARLLTALGAEVPLVTIFHGYDISAYVAARGPNVYAHLIRRGTLFLAACEAMRRRLLDLGCPKDRTAVQRMGVDGRRLPHAFRPAPSGAPFQFLFVGRLVEKKGADVLLDAFARVHARHRQTRLTLIGDGPLRPRLTASAEGLGDAVHFAGARTQAGVMAAMRDAHVLVQPSITAANGDIEASPVVLQEAMALGLPVIATRHGGIPELVDDGQSGLLADERDAAGLAQAMESLVLDDSLRSRLSGAARRKVTADFSLDHWNETLAERLRGLTDR